MTTLRWATAAAAATFAVTLLSGCSDVEKALNKGGDTKCSEYLTQSADTQRVTVTKFIKQQSGDESEPAGVTVDFTMASVQALCKVQANGDTQIKNADIAGIFVKK
ncbi:hypothetical protein LTV02_10875 [Nocardia yamanashiensis]|uniref:hypothetical protein n=1 Tax=Nocardia yamanashiensis TaxID=209247 RepID=UPI001E5B8C1A|nr:hypothetical protein [Nocardia yamanashiensis]UGT43850.1 hypothetical protein LTV02_10875 [Nocardia yamanashiensis]